MAKVITSLSRSVALRRLVRAVQAHRLANWWLRRFPIVKRLPGSGVIYRASRLESIPLAEEMLAENVLYRPEWLPAKLETFADLGCNVGYFACWLAHHVGGRALRGLMVDANPEAVAEAQWHAQANGWDQVYALAGIVGAGEPGSTHEFFVYESNICSAAEMPDVERLGLRGRWKRIQVPCLSLNGEWECRFGQAECDLLKVDIEGSEVEFLKRERAFLDRTGAVLIEWHKWRTSLDEVKALLGNRSFELADVLEETDDMGTGYFVRRRST